MDNSNANSSYYTDVHGNQIEITVCPSFDSVADKIVQEMGYLCKEHYQGYLHFNGLSYV